MHWFIDGELILAIDGHVITNVTGAEIPSEPLSIIMNTAVSKQWGFPSTCPSSCKVREPLMRVGHYINTKLT